MNENKESRDDIIRKVLLMGILNADGSYVKGSKNKIRSFFMKNHPTQTDFAQFIEKEYGWHGVAIIDTRTAYKPYDFYYNHAGLQFKYRDESQMIKLECLEWSNAAKRISKLIYDGQYLEPNVKNHTEKAR